MRVWVRVRLRLIVSVCVSDIVRLRLTVLVRVIVRVIVRGNSKSNSNRKKNSDIKIKCNSKSMIIIESTSNQRLSVRVIGRFRIILALRSSAILIVSAIVLSRLHVWLVLKVRVIKRCILMVIVRAILIVILRRPWRLRVVVIVIVINRAQLLFVCWIIGMAGSMSSRNVNTNRMCDVNIKIDIKSK